MDFTERIILHSDLNNFYASCECSLDLTLKDKPVAVCGSQKERHGIVLAKNYAAKAFGITTGDTVWQAKNKCKDLVVVEPHYDLYVKYSKLVRSIYATYTDRVEPFGMDECWLDLSDKNLSIEDGAKIADEIRNRVKSETGLTVSIGVSFNKIFAKLGSDLKKPDAVTVIAKENFKEKIFNLPAEDLLGVGRRTKKKLNSYGIYTIGDIANTEKSFFENLIGKNGELLWNYANGLDDSEVCPINAITPAKSIGHGTTTLFDLDDNDKVRRLILDLSQDIGHNLFLNKKRAFGVSVSIRRSDLEFLHFQETVPKPVQSAGEIAKIAYSIFEKNYSWEENIRAVTVTVFGLDSAETPTQLEFFNEVENDEKQENLNSCVENLKERFGMNSVIPCTLLDAADLTNQNRTKLTMPKGISATKGK